MIFKDEWRLLGYRLITMEFCMLKPTLRVFEQSDILECIPQSKSKVSRSLGLHSGGFTPIRSTIHLSIQNRPEFWIDPLHGVPIQIVQIPWGSVWVCKRGRMCLPHGFVIPIHDSNLHSCNILLIQHCFNEISHNKENDENWWHDSNFTSQIACLRT